MKGLPEEAANAILALKAMIEKEDEYVRLRQMKEFKRNDLFWHGFQYLFWSEMDQDWRIPTHEQIDNYASREDVSYEFNYVVNIFKAHGESIIAALSADIPDVMFGPRDAQDPDDRRAVETADNCVDLIQRWNRAKLLIINALFFLANEGFVASYTYNKKDPKFGTTNIPTYGQRMEQTGDDMANCDNCGYKEPANDPDTGNPVHSANEPCPQCQAPMQIEPGEQEMVPFKSDEKPLPKGREVVEVYGALNVRVPSYVSKLADAGYLVHYVDGHPAQFKAAFPDDAEEIAADPGQDYERLMRQSSIVQDGYSPTSLLATQWKGWIRPWYYLALDDKETAGVAYLQKKYPHGLFTSIIGETICECRDESMDAHWSITKAGPSKGVHADPLLQSLVPLQEITNNLENLFVMQVEYGIPATYADSEVFDFEGQSRMEASPGFVYPVTPRPGQSIDGAFYSEKTAVLSKESTNLQQLVTEQGQFVVGSFPSVFGGASTSGSKTLGEYEKSRTYALQRLSIVWYFINVWWGETMHNAVNSFIEHQIEDEPMTSVSATAPGGFQTKWIRSADFKGSFDRLEPEVSTDFPSTFAQKRQILMGILQLNNDMINTAVLTPENAGIIRQYVGLKELKLPDEIQANKQLREIAILIGMEPTEDENGGMVPSVDVEPDVDDNPIHIKVLVDFLADDIGQDLALSNPGGYANCVAHLQKHKMAMMPPPMPGGMPGMPPPQLGPGGPPPPGPGGPGKVPPPKPNGPPGGMVQ